MIDERSIKKLMATSGAGGGGASTSGCSQCQNVCQSEYQLGCTFGEGDCAGACQNGYQDLCNDNNEGCGSECQSNCQLNYQCGGCQSSCQNCQTGCQVNVQNTAPTTPTNIAAPAEARRGERIEISWGSSTDTNLAGYILEKRENNGSFTQIYRGASRTFTDTVSQSATSLVYRVKAYDTGGLYSSYRTSSPVSIITNSSPTISDRDRDLGGKKEAFDVSISINDIDSEDVLVLTAKLNGEILKTIDNAKRNQVYTFNISKSKLESLEINKPNEIEISVSDSKAISFRRYTFRRLNSAPTITLDNANLGLQNQPFSIGYTVRDPEGDPVSIRISYGTRVLKVQESVSQGQKQTFKISHLDFSQIPQGDHVIKLEATDQHGGREVKLVSFSKEINGCGYILRKDTNAMAKQMIIAVNAELAEGADLKIQVCNNARDTNPTWETVENKVLYTISNKSKTAGKWAVGVKVEITRQNKEVEDSYLYGIGVNYR